MRDLINIINEFFTPDAPRAPMIISTVIQIARKKHAKNMAGFGELFSILNIRAGQRPTRRWTTLVSTVMY